MNPAELHPCGRCHRSGRDLDVRLTLANLAREAVMERREYAGPMVRHEYRCRPCREAVRNRTPLPQPVTEGDQP